MSDKGPCMRCNLENPVFLHNLYRENNALQFCTSCLLASFPGAFCPICFQLYEKEDFDSTENLVQCLMCPVLAHFNCVYSNSSSTSTSVPSTSNIPPANYICPSCSYPNFKFFNCQRDAITQLVCIDKHLSQELLAAAIISQRCMKEAAALCLARVETLARASAEANKEAKKALEHLAELTMPPTEEQDEDDDFAEISSDISSEEIDDEESDGEESHDEESNSDEEEDNSDEDQSEESSGDESG